MTQFFWAECPAHAGLFVFIFQRADGHRVRLHNVGGMLWGAGHEYLVAVTTVDVIVAAWRVPNLIKIDVEGAERRVLEGVAQTLESHRPLVIIEVRKDKKTVMQIFKSHGYILFDPAAKELDTPLSECLFDTLAVPREHVTESQTAILKT